MPERKPIDKELLALAGLTKAGLRDIDAAIVGGNSRSADQIDLRKVAGIDKGRNTPQRHRPNLLKGLDFIEPPKSRPLGAVAMDGSPIREKIDFMPIPEDMNKNVHHQLELISKEEVTPEKQVPMVGQEAPVVAPVSSSNGNFDFDLFQYSILRDILKNLDSSIDSVEESLLQLRNKKELILKMIKGCKNE